MDPITQQTTLASAGGKKDPVYVDDVFSTYLYEGTAATQSINNGIDLAGEGGLVWLKNRDLASDHLLFDTERGAAKEIASNQSRAERATGTNALQSFNSNGFSLGGDWVGENRSGKPIVSWTFRKAPGFFDVVTWTGNDTAGRQISHALGSTPGMILVKCTNHTYSWNVYHRSLTGTHYLELETTGSAGPNANIWNNTNPTSTHFTLGDSVTVNKTGKTYVAYIFAHDDQSFGTDGDESIIKCGSYTGTSADGNLIDLGFEPQWLMVKKTDTGDAYTSWVMQDTMRGLNSIPYTTASGFENLLFANMNIGEGKRGNGSTADNRSQFLITSTGFAVENARTEFNVNGGNYVYMAIRRPNKPPEAATDVFAIDTKSAGRPGYTSNFPVDLVFNRNNINSSDSTSAETRLTSKQLVLSSNAAESFYMSDTFRCNTGWDNGGGVDTTDYAWMYKRAPGFMDVVAYTGTLSSSGSQTVPHNLGVTPELILVKRRSGSTQWYVYSNALTTPLTQKLVLNDSADESDSLDAWGASGSPTAPNENNFTVGYNQGYNGTGSSGSTYVAYLFASLPGISKVGSYTGTGSALNVDCGFTNGARFVLIKRTDSNGHWYVWDTTRGITNGNDSRLKLNDSAAQQTDEDHIDPLNAGFSIPVSGDVNYSGGTYIFLAIA